MGGGGVDLCYKTGDPVIILCSEDNYNIKHLKNGKLGCCFVVALSLLQTPTEAFGTFADYVDTVQCGMGVGVLMLR